MEGRSAHKATKHARKGSACLERDGVGIWDSGLMNKPLADTCHSFWSNKGVIEPVHKTTVDNVSGGVQVPQLLRRAKKAPAYIQNYLPLPSIMLRGSSCPKEANHLSFFPALHGGCEMGLHRTMGHIPGSSQTQFNKVDVQLSEVCQRRFVMFDRCGSKRRMIFHPSLVNEFPALLSPSLPAETGACNLPDKVFSQRVPAKIGVCNSDTLLDKAFSQKDLAMVAPFLSASATPTPVDSTLPNYNSHLLLRKVFMDSPASASDNSDNPLSFSREDAEAQREQDGAGMPEPSCFSHENTEDLEALLSSDEDEVSSTGHSPSDVTRNISPLENYSNKRKNREEDNLKNGDTCSTATSGMKMCKEAPCQNVDAAGIDVSHDKESFVVPHKVALVEDLAQGTGDLTAFDMVFPDEASSSSSANNPKWDNKLLAMQQQQQADGLSRKEKIKSILRHLRGVIPGGESMDTAFVLDEAIQYVKTLQFEVQKLQARKLI